MNLEKELERLKKQFDNVKLDKNPDLTTDEKEIIVLEKICLCLVKLKKWDECISEGYKLIGRTQSNPNSIGYKVALAGLAHQMKVEEMRSLVDGWKKVCPKDPQMQEIKQKIDYLLNGIRSGLSHDNVFSNIEENLGLELEWEYRINTYTSGNWKFRPPPKSNQQYYLCPRNTGHCMYGQQCIAAHSKEELAEWNKRKNLEKQIAEKLNKNTGKNVPGAVNRQFNGIGNGVNTEENGRNFGNERNSQYPTQPITPSPWFNKPHNLTNESNSFNNSSTQKYNVPVHRPNQFPNQPDSFVEKHNFAYRYLQDLQKKMAECTDQEILFAEDIQTVKFKSDFELTYTGDSKEFTWTMVVASKDPLRTVALIQDLNRNKFYISSIVYHSVQSNKDVDLFPLNSLDPQSKLQVVSTFIPSNMLLYLGNWPDRFFYKIKITFTTDQLGPFNQAVLFDFKNPPFLVKYLNVDPPLTSIIQQGPRTTVISRPSSSPPLELDDDDLFNEGEKLTKDKYHLQMSYFLNTEQEARVKELSKYDLYDELRVIGNYTVEINDDIKHVTAFSGQFFTKIYLNTHIEPDDPKSKLILNNCHSVGVEIRGKTEQLRIVEKLKTVIIVVMTPKTVNEHRLSIGSIIKTKVSFLFDATTFGRMRFAIAQSNSILDFIFPDVNLPIKVIHNTQNLFDGDFVLNDEQRKVYHLITGIGTTPPIVIIGPFGTGKTYTLAQCIKKLVCLNKKILICTQSNSAADLYISQHLSLWTKEGHDTNILRVSKESRQFSVSPNKVIKSSLIESKNLGLPDKIHILNSDVVIVTLSTSYHLCNLGLGKDLFSHIFLDEAAQAYEGEAIQPLIYAGTETKIILAGDHMQLPPESYCGKGSTLLDRLNKLYPKGHHCRVLLSENYRSHEAIVNFSSLFYNAPLKASSLQPEHSNFYPITFFHVEGKESQQRESTSFFNVEEVKEIVKRVKEILASWPKTWGDAKEEHSIAVLSTYTEQVSRIRSTLKAAKLGYVNVESVNNIQGHQYRVVLITTVRTVKDLKFFSSTQLFNTAVTRASSLVAVVGNAKSLCTMGDCKKYWTKFVSIAAENKSLFGVTLNDLLKKVQAPPPRISSNAELPASSRNGSHPINNSEKFKNFTLFGSNGSSNGLSSLLSNLGQPTKLNYKNFFDDDLVETNFKVGNSYCEPIGKIPNIQTSVVNGANGLSFFEDGTLFSAPTKLPTPTRSNSNSSMSSEDLLREFPALGSLSPVQTKEPVWTEVKKRVKPPKAVVMTPGDMPAHEKIAQLVSMGFEKWRVIKALSKSNKDLNMALEILLSEKGK